MKNYIMGRVEAKNIVETIRIIKHNYRSYKNIPSVINTNQNYKIINGKLIPFNNINTNINHISKHYKQLLEDNKKEHRKIFKQNKGYYLNSKQVKSTYNGVIGFSNFNIQSHSLKDRLKIVKQVEKNLSDFCIDMGSELQDLVLHTDEKGEFHFHFLMKSYNNKGVSLKMVNGGPKGKLLQDYLSYKLKPFKIIRGENNSKKKHLTIKDYELQQDRLKELEDTKKKLEDTKKGLEDTNKTLQDTKQELEDLNIEKQELEDTNKILDKQNSLFTINNINLQNSLEQLIIDINKIINNIVNIDKENNYNKKIKKIIDYLPKYLNKQNKQGLENLLKKSNKLLNSVNKTYNNPMNGPKYN